MPRCFAQIANAVTLVGRSGTCTKMNEYLYFLHNSRVVFGMWLSASNLQAFSLSCLCNIFVTGRLFGLFPPQEASEAPPQL